MKQMIEKIFLKDSYRTAEEERFAKASLFAYVGVVANIVLFLLKAILGLMVNSLSLLSDAFNNLSDTMNFVLSLVAAHLSKKPADEEHPFGHGRIEYIMGFVITIIIFLAAYEFLKQSIERILHPNSLTFSYITIISLVISIIIKLWLAKILKNVGKEIDHVSLIASGSDSLNDAVITSVVLLSFFLYRIRSDIPFDGIAGVMVSIFILISGYGIAKDTIGRLLGNNSHTKLMDEIKEIILSREEILSIHDLVLHDYGPTNKMASAHVEMDSQFTLLKAHSIIDQIEDEINKRYGIQMTIHIDTIDIHNERRARIESYLQAALEEYYPELHIHGLHLEGKKNIHFDIEVPFSSTIDEDKLVYDLTKKLEEKGEDVQIHVTFDQGFTSRG
ncbi:MAG: cation transporter [Solobacterium sp.]|nr:cation transporter [Solobacterium sp.]